MPFRTEFSRDAEHCIYYNHLKNFVWMRLQSSGRLAHVITTLSSESIQCEGGNNDAKLWLLSYTGRMQRFIIQFSCDSLE